VIDVNTGPQLLSAHGLSSRAEAWLAFCGRTDILYLENITEWVA
jgi:hypothetical protein